MRRLALWVVPAVLLAWWAPPVLAAAELPGRPAITQAAPAPAPAADQAPTVRDYAAREARAQQLQQWTGGYEGGVYIGGSAIALALLIVLIILVIR